MHLPDGFLSTPLNAATALVSLGACAVAIRQANRTLGERQVPLLGVTGAFIFAAQMLNFPIGAGTSGHLMGTTLATVLLGPLNACLVMAIVLGIQCLLFADGGLTALGSNIFNMGVVGSLVSFLVIRALSTMTPNNPKGETAAIGLAAWASVMVASAACSIEIALSGTAPLTAVLRGMLSVHALIGIGEAIITCAVVSTIRNVRADLLSPFASAQTAHTAPSR